MVFHVLQISDNLNSSRSSESNNSSSDSDENKSEKEESTSENSSEDKEIDDNNSERSKEYDSSTGSVTGMKKLGSCFLNKRKKNSMRNFLLIFDISNPRL